MLSAKPKNLFVRDLHSGEDHLLEQLRQMYELVEVQSPLVKVLGKLGDNRMKACMCRAST